MEEDFEAEELVDRELLQPGELLLHLSSPDRREGITWVMGITPEELHCPEHLFIRGITAVLGEEGVRVTMDSGWEWELDSSLDTDSVYFIVPLDTDIRDTDTITFIRTAAINRRNRFDAWLLM